LPPPVRHHLAVHGPNHGLDPFRLLAVLLLEREGPESTAVFRVLDSHALDALDVPLGHEILLDLSSVSDRHVRHRRRAGAVADRPKLQHRRRLARRKVLEAVGDGVRVLLEPAQLVAPIGLHVLHGQAIPAAEELVPVDQRQLLENAINPGVWE
jgi:hypothetical protein